MRRFVQVAPFRQPVFTFNSRGFARIALQDAEEGDVFHREGRWWIVDEVLQNVKKGSETRQSRIVLKDLQSGAKKEVRVKSAEKVETVDLGTRECELVEVGGKNVKLKALDDGEDIDVPLDMLGVAEFYLKSGDQLLLKTIDEKPLRLEPPKHVTVRVKDVPPRADQAAETKRIAILENGRKVKVPSHVEKGDEIVIRLPDETFSGNN